MGRPIVPHRPTTYSPAPIPYLPSSSLSTSLLALIHGIMARSFSPTSSIGCASLHAARRLEPRHAGLELAHPLRGERAGLDVLQDRFISALVSAVMMRGPETYSPNSAVLEIE